MQRAEEIASVLRCVSEHTSATESRIHSALPRFEIGKAILTIAALTAIVRFVSVAKELTVAWRFGTGDDFEAFVMAALIPLAVISIVSSSFNSSFIPVYISIRERAGQQAAQGFVRSTSALVLIVLVVLTIIIMCAAPAYLPLLGSGFDQHKLDYSTKLLYVIAPVVIVSGMGALWAAVLNAETRFASPAISPLATPAITVLLLWLAPFWRGRSLIAGLLLGELVETFVLAAAMKRQGLSLFPGWPSFDVDSRQLLSQYWPLLLGSGLMAVNLMVDQGMAAMLPSGSVAALSYANSVVQFPILLFATALGVAVLPYFSRHVAAGTPDELRETVHRLIRVTLCITVPISALLFFFSHPVVSLLFKRGAFTDSDVGHVAQVTTYFALQIPFYLAGIILARCVSALRQNRILLWGASLVVLINAVLNYLFMKVMGVAGIALSTSISYVFLASFSYLAISKFLATGARVK